MTTGDDAILHRLFLVRGHVVLLQTDLAHLCGVSAEGLLAQARNFPGDFCFPLDPVEIAELSADGRGGVRRMQAFTEHGAVLAAFLINTPAAVAAGIQIARTFSGFRSHPGHPPALALTG